jgi:thiamine pyrophosphokinase
VFFVTTKFIILANGEINDFALLNDRLSSLTDAIVIAADGGYLHSENLDLAVDVLIGDLDSLSPQDRDVLEAQGVAIKSFPEAKDETDLELALIHAVNAGAEEIIVIGAWGGRLDMSIANLLLLILPQFASVRIEVWAEQQSAWVIHPPGGEIWGETGDTVSLIPVAGDAAGITSKNLVYELIDATLIVGEARGVSNVLTAKVGYLGVERGTVLVVHTPGRA